MRRAAGERAGWPVGPVVDLLDCGQDAFPQLLRTDLLPLRTFETVLKATPARSAISAIVAGFDRVISPDFVTYARPGP